MIIIYRDIASLVKVTNEADKFGELTKTTTKREVFISTRSVGMKEVYEAHAYGLKPEIVFLLASKYDYDNEEFIEYEDVTYKVIRTYQKNTNEQLEIVCERTLNKGEGVT